MKELNVVLTELGISKVRLAKYLGVSHRLQYFQLEIGICVERKEYDPFLTPLQWE